MSASWIDRARSESIFCCPRTREDFFLRELRFPVWLVVAGFAECVDVVGLCVVVAGFCSPESDWRALAIGTTAQARAIQKTTSIRDWKNEIISS
jgi:hypothetical protein